MEKLAHIDPPVKDRSKYLRDLANGFEKGQIFLTALELDLFTLLQTDRNVESVSEELGTQSELTMRFLDVLVALGLLSKEGERYRTSSDVTPFLGKDAPYAARYLQFGIRSRETWIRLSEILKDGPTGEEGGHTHNYDDECIGWMARGSLLGRLQGTVKQLQGLPEFADATKLIDLGGGHGLFGIAFAQENPNLSVVIFDAPDVTPITQTYIDRYNMNDRVTTLSGDYTKDDLGSEYDIAFEACSFGGNSEDSKSFYRQVWKALKKGGLFVRLTFTIDDDRTGPLSSLIWDLKDHMTGHSHMHMLTTSELFDTLAEVGFRKERIIDMSSCLSMPMRMVISRK